jgi:hypothetical protein
MPVLEGVADGLGDELADGSFAVEFHLAFGGVDIDVHLAGIEFEEQAGDGVPAFHEDIVIAFDEGGVEAAVFDGTPVDEDVLVVAGGAGDAGGADPAPDADGGGWGGFGGGVGGVGGDAGGAEFGVFVEGEQLEFGTEEEAEAFAQGVEGGGGGIGMGERGELPGGAIFLEEGESDLGMGEGDGGEDVLDMGAFGIVATEEFAAGGDVEEEVADFDGGAWGGAGFADLEDFTAVDDEGGGGGVG